MRRNVRRLNREVSRGEQSPLLLPPLLLLLLPPPPVQRPHNASVQSRAQPAAWLLRRAAARGRSPALCPVCERKRQQACLVRGCARPTAAAGLRQRPAVAELKQFVDAAVDAAEVVLRFKSDELAPEDRDAVQAVLDQGKDTLDPGT